MNRSCGSNKATLATGGAFQPRILLNTIITCCGADETLMPLQFKLAFRRTKTVFGKKRTNVFLSICTSLSQSSASHLFVSRRSSSSRQTDAASIKT